MLGWDSGARVSSSSLLIRGDHGRRQAKTLLRTPFEFAEQPLPLS
jgi:hypothetical protein